MEFLFKDTSFKFETLRAAGFAVDNGADLSEVLLTAAAIPEGDEEAWMREWKATADRVHERAKYSQEHGDKISAREAFLRASAYYRSAEFYRRKDPANDPHVPELFGLSRDTFVKAGKLLDGPFEEISIPYGKDTLPGYLLSFVSLDGVIQSPGGPEEDTSGGFAYGGWIFPYSDDVLGTVINRQMNMPFDLLLGHKTFEIWAPYWPQRADEWPGVNAATKYVASNTMTSHEWQPSVFLGGDIAEKVIKIKQQQGPDLHVYGSGNLVQTLIKHNLVDAFWLKIFPRSTE
jgi:dihydrofolate reductase